jgi:hypothetical protein
MLLGFFLLYLILCGLRNLAIFCATFEYCLGFWYILVTNVRNLQFRSIFPTKISL